MQFSKNETIFIPDGVTAAFPRTTHLCVSAHQDDIEFMAYHAIAECFQREDAWFSACVTTDGAGSPRSGIYAKYTNDDMKNIRIKEQNKAAVVGEYAAQIQLGYASSEVKDATNGDVVASLAAVISACQPEVVLTHNLADKHDTHVSVALRVIAAIRSLPAASRPKLLYGMEVWRGLDWMPDSEKVIFDASAHPNLAAALMGVYDSQISGGKRYDAAVIGRRMANATFFESHGTDTMTEAIYAMDMTPLIESSTAPEVFIAERIDSMKTEILNRVAKFD